jgi:dTDP-4-dehydrorhamnose 3,5-epimerase-like enzyme
VDIPPQPPHSERRTGVKFSADIREMLWIPSGFTSGIFVFTVTLAWTMKRRIYSPHAANFQAESAAQAQGHAQIVQQSGALRILFQILKRSSDH